MLHLPLPALLGLLFGVSELWLAMRRRSRSGGGHARQDRRSLIAFWLVIPASVYASTWLAASYPGGQIGGAWPAVLGTLLFAAGLLLRWYAIRYLGRWFTVDVAIHPEQVLIDGGPYRWVRHPSYSGALLALAGIGLASGSWLGWIAMVVPVVAVFGYRIHIEEQALAMAFGSRWSSYCATHRRLVPGLY